ncbi:type II TA system antitoxin MqsA family protein [Agrobacterium vitis]|uniref:Type II toxin-antitoxin system MqsA family antitoxin n=1 Tax=Agrobacterium vitis TaxID=373 RepID=A0AAE2RF48_AGRVI|nr:type II TA system antitoxin MqsA family protein [Agrobacterium vitis]MBF2717400.1 type II toxin-antitoxin system MqsA family antitoxin [Agrobacterium vitis]MUZ61135.1 YgiT-type zinc finger protein [Agrobacterium vitis]MVA20119.1 YgiT-type zinc finger protein [Agrobacterium vitis]
MKCPVCGGAELTHETREIPYTYKGKTITIKGIEGDFCHACNEVILDRLNGDEYATKIRAFKRQVNEEAGIDPDFIAKVRKKLDLDQKEAGRVFGGGDNAFSRYERGRAKPPVSLVKLLTILDKHPELMAEVK